MNVFRGNFKSATSLHNNHRICLHFYQVFAVTRKINNFRLYRKSGKPRNLSLDRIEFLEIEGGLL